MAAFLEQVTDPTHWTAGTAELVRTPSVVRPEIQSVVRPFQSAAALARDRRRSLLSTVVKAEILPRLVLARRVADGRQAGTTAAIATAIDHAAELLHLVLTEDAARAIAFVEMLHSRGATPEALYLGILTDTARQLGELWLADRADFVQVTISMGRLQQVLRALSSSFQADAVRRSDAHSVLLVPAPGEQHTFGLLLLGEFFRRAGWHIAGGPASCDRDAVETVRDTWFDVVAFSIGSTGLLDGLEQCIRRVGWRPVDARTARPCGARWC
jgi:MerR family transcriptional regulator, light-induced transcriptional regulator